MIADVGWNLDEGNVGVEVNAKREKVNIEVWRVNKRSSGDLASLQLACTATIRICPMRIFSCDICLISNP